MSKRDRRVVNLADFKAKRRDEGAIDVVAEDGNTYRIDPPELWPDEASERAEAGDLVAAARAVMGAEQYEAWVAAGGTASLVMAIIADEHGVTVGESPASSSS